MPGNIYIHSERCGEGRERVSTESKYREQVQRASTERKHREKVHRITRNAAAAPAVTYMGQGRAGLLISAHLRHIMMACFRKPSEIGAIPCTTLWPLLSLCVLTCDALCCENLRSSFSCVTSYGLSRWCMLNLMCEEHNGYMGICST